MSEPRLCREGHLIDGDNKVWRVDKRRAGGGHWTCQGCWLRAKNDSQARLKAKSDRAHAKRKDAEKSSRVKVLIENAATEVASGVDVDVVVEKYATKIVRAKMRHKNAALVGLDQRGRVEFVRNVIVEAVGNLAKDESKKPWSYLRVKPVAENAWAQFNDALEEARTSGVGVPKCENDAATYSDYDEEQMPSAFEARMACNGCPLLVLCGEYAKADKPAWGVWAGKRWAYGQVVND